MAAQGSTSPGRLVAGVDLGGTKVLTIVQRDGAVLGTAKHPTPEGSADDVAATIADAVRAAATEGNVDGHDLTAVGVGTPGIVVDGVVSLSPNIASMHDPFDLGGAISKRLDGVPTHVDNDVTVATLGELHRGAGRAYSSFLLVAVGTGVGGGLVLDRRVWRGRGAAGEIGHMTVKPDGRRCGCGGKGHLESYAGRASMQGKAERLVAAGEHTVLFDLMAKHDRDRMTSGIIEKALKHGDHMTRHLMDRAVWALGIALASCQNLLDVEAVIVGGGLAERFGQPFVDRIAAETGKNLFGTDPPAMVPSGLGDLSGAVGAAELAATTA